MAHRPPSAATRAGRHLPSPTLVASHRPTLSFGLALRLALLTFILAAVCLRDGADLAEYRTRQAAAPLAFNLLDWELRAVAAQLDSLMLALRGARPVADEADRAAIRGYFQAPAATRPALRGAAEPAIERLVSDALRAEGLTAPSFLAAGRPVLFPPVSFTFTEPPQVLIVSPRERIRVSQYVLLRPSLSREEIERLEDGVARRGLSTIVTPIGGLATYPAMVLEGGPAESVLGAVAHEWVHGYFFFQPLGRGYWADQDVRTINETAAELAGDELGRRLARDLGLLAEPRPTSPAPRQSEFNTIMRATRLEVDRLLGLARVEDAERYMEARRRELNDRGYAIRRLNQAYFAFHGSYAEGPAGGANPIAAQVRRLRTRAASLGEFLRLVAQVSGPADLAALVPGS